MKMTEDQYLAHYGILRRSGRYPWGSGGNVESRSRSFLDYIREMFNLGMSESEIARGLSTEDAPFTTTDLRAARTIARNQAKAADIAFAQRLRKKGLSHQAIGERFDPPRNESSVRAMLAPGAKDRSDLLTATSQKLKEAVDEKGYIDIGPGVESYAGVSRNNLDVAAAMLREQGYTIHTAKVPQLGTNHETNVKVVAPPGTKWQDVQNNPERIQSMVEFSEDGGRTWNKIQDPINIDSSRVEIRYAEDGGAENDGVIYIRPGVEDLSMGGRLYAQTRISVDGTHYLKGMAIQNDNLPEGVDILFNTNKEKGTPKLEVLKPLNRDANGNVDKDLPFGANIQRQVLNDKGENTSAINVVNDATDWEDWSRSLASQMLSKQKPALIKEQLDLTYEQKKAEFDEIMSLTNPTVKQTLLESFSDDVDASAVHLKAAAMPGQNTHVILPMNSLKDTEVYAPAYNNGDRIALVRYPHGGIFEIPQLTVNNRNPEGRRILGNQETAAIGINANVAARLSGADFDGDTVVAIPNNDGKITSSSPIAGLKDFDPQNAYPGYPGMKVMNNTQAEMGMVSNLITDMTIKGADQDEIARAVRHSMVVIDAEKKELNYRQSELDNGIKSLRKKYQDKAQGGASTLLSLSTSTVRVPDFKPRPAKDGGPVDAETGEKKFVETGRTYWKKDKAASKKAGKDVWVEELSKVEVQRGAITSDADSLSSGTLKERLYVTHANRLKALANTARKEQLNVKPVPYSPSAKKTYEKEVKSLNAKLNIALKNSPRERQAQVIGNSIVKAKRQANPNLDPSDVKKIRAHALKEARHRTGAGKERVHITESEWKAIQAGAISNSRLKTVLRNSDLDEVKKLAMPRTKVLMSSSKISRAQSLLARGYTQAEVAQQLGVGLTTLKEGLK